MQLMEDAQFTFIIKNSIQQNVWLQLRYRTRAVFCIACLNVLFAYSFIRETCEKEGHSVWKSESYFTVGVKVCL